MQAWKLDRYINTLDALYTYSSEMINVIPPKKRIPELKLTKLEVPEKKAPSSGQQSFTTMVDGIPIVEYFCESEMTGKEYSDSSDRSSVICLDSCDSLSNSPPQDKIKTDGPLVGPGNYPLVYVDFSENPFSPEPVGIPKYEAAIQMDVSARKKPTRWDCITPAYRIDAGKQVECSPVPEIVVLPAPVSAKPKFELQPRDPRVKTFKKHHTVQVQSQPPQIPEPTYPPKTHFTPKISGTHFIPKISGTHFTQKIPETHFAPNIADTSFLPQLPHPPFLPQIPQPPFPPNLPPPPFPPFPPPHLPPLVQPPQSSHVTYESLMDISSPEYNPPSPFGSPSPPPRSPIPSVPKKKRVRGFFDSDSEASEMDFSMESKFLEMFNSRVLPDAQEGAPFMGPEKRGCFWDSSSADESVNPARETLESIKLSSSKEECRPKKRKATSRRKRNNYSSDDLETKYNRSEEKRKVSRSKSTSSVRESRDRYNETSKASRISPPIINRIRSPIQHEQERRRPQHVCIYCGCRGHFSNDACPLRVCSMCFKIGHNFRECKLWGKGRSPKCGRCQISCHEKSMHHLADHHKPKPGYATDLMYPMYSPGTCGEIWRQCHNTTSLPTDYPASAKKKSYTLSKEIQTFRVDQLKSSVYCCNCAKYGHTFFQCEKARPSRYFFIPLVGHHDIPMSAGFRELRRNVDTRRCLPQMLPKSFQVVKQQRFWGDGHDTSSSSSSEDSTADTGSQGDKSKEHDKERGVKREENKPSRHTSDTERSSDQLRRSEDSDTARALDLQQLEYQKAAINAYHLAFARAHRGESLYAREILNSRGFITVGAYPVSLLSETNKVSVEERRQLTRVVYLPDRTPSYPQRDRDRSSPTSLSSTTRIDESNLQICESHASFSRPVKSGPTKFFPGTKIPKFRRGDRTGYKGKPGARVRERREKEKRKFDKSKRANSRILDARECINRNRTKRHAERQVRLSERERSKSPKGDKRSSPASRKERSPRRTVVKKERTDVKLEQGETQSSQECETFLCIDEAN